MPSPQYARVLEVLGKYMSPILARSVLKRAIERAGVDDMTLSESNLHQVIDNLEDGTRLFVERDKAGKLRDELVRLGGKRPDVAPAEIRIREERDISQARLDAWQMAERLGARRYTLQRVATIVSELARNIASYTGGGVIELTPNSERNTLGIRARDKGPGIPNLDEIMAGHYRSKTGLGVGIVATKRLADRFDIRTGVAGTTVEIEVRL